MKLIKDLGMRYPTKTSKAKYRYGIYECLGCGEKFERRSCNVAEESDLCKKCFYKTKVKVNKRLKNIHGKIIERIQNTKVREYKNYGGRGISMCKEWHDYDTFESWALKNGYKEHLTIDRRDNDGNYEPSNCRWVTQTVQSRNTRTLYAHNKSGYRGVRFRKDRSKWSTQIAIDNKSVSLGVYETAQEAGMAFDAYVIQNSLEHTTNGLITKDEAMKFNVFVSRREKSTSTYRGISKHTQTGNWVAKKIRDGKIIFQQIFKKESEAIIALENFNRSVA